MSKFIFIFSLILLTAYTAFAKQYSCTKCVSEGKNCNSNDKAPNCDYCVKIDGFMSDIDKVPDMAKTYLHDNHPSFKCKSIIVFLSFCGFLKWVFKSYPK